MPEAHAELDAMQAAYKSAAEHWVTAIRAEVALASVAHNVLQIDQWEGARYRQEEARGHVLDARKAYEDALRLVHFDF